MKFKHLLAAVIVATGIGVGCGPVAPPVVTPNPPPVTILIDTAITLRSVDGRVLNEALSTVVLDLDAQHPLTSSGFRPGFLIPAQFRGSGATITVKAPDMQTRSARFVVPITSEGITLDGGDKELILQLAFKKLPGLVGHDTYFMLDNGERITIVGATDFNLFYRFLTGDIRSVLNQRAELGFNWLRVFTAYNVCPPGSGCQEIGRLVPSEHPDYYSKVIDFIHLCATYGLRVELVGLSGPYDTTFGNSVDRMVEHWDRLRAAVQGETSVTLELINEADQPANNMDGRLPIERFARPVGVVASHGSNGSRATPVRPAWDYETYHTNGAPEWWRQGGHNCMEFSVGVEDIPASHVPCIADEKTRGDDQDASPAHFEDDAATATMLAGGSTYHSVAGKNSTLWIGRQLELAMAHVRGALKIPLRCQDGGYGRPDDVAHFLRVYSHGNDPACITSVRY